MALEYASSGKLNTRFDVFSFVVVLLLLVNGKNHVDVSQTLGDKSLVEWVCIYYETIINLILMSEMKEKCIFYREFSNIFVLCCTLSF